MASEDEDGMVVGRIVSPPALPRLVPRSRAAAEHVPAHDGRAGPAEDVLGERRARVDLAAFLAVALAECLERDQPTVELLTAGTERTLLRLARAGDEAVDRHRDVQLQLAHRSSLCRHAPRTARRPRSHRSGQELDEAATARSIGGPICTEIALAYSLGMSFGPVLPPCRATRRGASLRERRRHRRRPDDHTGAEQEPEIDREH